MSNTPSSVKICGVEPESIVDGPGFRYVLFTQGCPHHCPGCHNPQSHDFEAGKWVSIEEIVADFDENPLLSGITFSGGEPFCQPEALVELGKRIIERKKSIFLYSGYTLEELLKMAQERSAILELLQMASVLVDGRFIEAQRDISLRFRGSTNQRAIDLPHFFETGEIRKLYED